MQSPRTIFETDRLRVRLAAPADAPLIHALWTDPRVMGQVGFPRGLRMTPDEVRADIAARAASEFTQLLVIEIRGTGQAIGQAVMHLPDAAGVSETDIKLLPEFWGQGYGTEIKRGLLRHLFRHTDCRGVQATPNVLNPASLRMQEKVGGVRVGEGVHQFPEHMRIETTPVHYYLYQVLRSDWEARQTAEGQED